MQQILRVQASAKILQNQTSKWIIYRSFRLNTLSMNLSVGDKLRSVSNDGNITGIISRFANPREIPFSPPKMTIRFSPLFGLRFKNKNFSGDFGI